MGSYTDLGQLNQQPKSKAQTIIAATARASAKPDPNAPGSPATLPGQTKPPVAQLTDQLVSEQQAAEAEAPLRSTLIGSAATSKPKRKTLVGGMA